MPVSVVKKIEPPSTKGCPKTRPTQPATPFWQVGTSIPTQAPAAAPFSSGRSSAQPSLATAAAGPSGSCWRSSTATSIKEMTDATGPQSTPPVAKITTGSAAPLEADATQVPGGRTAPGLPKAAWSSNVGKAVAALPALHPKRGPCAAP